MSGTELKHCLRDALDGFEVHDVFAGSHDIEQIRDPQIIAKEVGKIDLPLSSEQAQQIISKAHPATLSQGDDEIFDATVENAWELSPPDFEITAGPQWDALLNDILQVVSTKLSIVHPVQTRLRKMVLYGQGARVKTRRDTEISPSVFGTLTIALPSSHEGGDAVVRYLDREKVLSTSKCAMTSAFWYSDAKYEILPITSGYRWVLIYDLATPFSPEKPLGNIFLREVMKSWARPKKPGDTRPVYYALSDEYSQAILSLVIMKSRDRLCVEESMSAGQDLGFHIFLATLQCLDNHCTFQNTYWNHTARSVYDLSGNEIRSGITIDKSDILQHDPFDKCLDKEEDGEFMTIKGTSVYEISALVIVPPNGTLEFFMPGGTASFGYRPNPHWSEAFNYLMDRYRSLESESMLEILLHLLQEQATTGELDYLLDKPLWKKLYQLALTCNGSGLLNWITTLPFPFIVLSWARTQFDMSAISFERLGMMFSHLVKARGSLNFQYQAILAFLGDTDPSDELRGLLRNTATEIISHREPIRSYEDGLALFDLAIYSYNDLEVMKASIIPGVIKLYRDSTVFMLGFIYRWRQSMRRNQISLDEAKPIYEDLVQVTILNMSISGLGDEMDAFGTCGHDQEYSDDILTRETRRVTYRILHSFAVSLFQPGFEEQRNKFIEKISIEAKFITSSSFQSLWIPLFQDLLFASQKLKISLCAPVWQRVYQVVLQAFLQVFVGKPLPKPNFLRQCLPCSCSCCKELNRFLLNPTQQVARFILTTREMTHIKNKRLGFDIGWSSEQEECSFYTVFTKSDRKAKEQQRLREERKLEAAKLLYAFDQQKLKSVLAEKYEAIMMMSVLEDPEDADVGGLLGSPSMQTREVLAPVSTNPAQEIVRLEAEMDRLINSTPSTAPSPTKNATTYVPPTTSAVPAHMGHRTTVSIPSRGFASPHTNVSGANRVVPSSVHSTTRTSRTVWSYFDQGPNRPVPPVSRVSGRSATRPVSRPSRPPPSRMIPHPVAGAKRKQVELIDLTLDDD